MTWALVFVMFNTKSYTNTASVIPGYSSQQTCEAAGAELKAKANGWTVSNYSYCIAVK